MRRADAPSHGPDRIGALEHLPRLLADETEKWANVIRAANIKPE
jgi:hypothetical protein